MKTLVFGVLGNFSYRPINLKLGEREYDGTLISALKEHYDADLLLFAPESLITFISPDIKESYELLINWEKLTEAFKNTLKKGAINADFVEIIPAIGRYIKRDNDTPYTLDFYTEPTTIRSIMFLSLIKKIHEKHYDRLILDVSIGLNLYISILQDIYRDIIVNRKLKRIFTEFSSNTWIAEIPPVIGDTAGRTYRVSEREYDVKVFFEFPYKTRFPEIGNIIDFSLIKSKEQGKRVISDYSKIKECMALYKIIFNAIKYNTPLMLTSEFFKKELEDKECLNLNLMDCTHSIFKKLREIWLNQRTVDIEGNIIKINYPTLKSEEIKTVYHSAALAYALQQEYKTKIFELVPYTSRIMSTFENMYDALEMNLNKRFLRRDITNIESVFKKSPENKWFKLSEMLNYENREGNRKAPPGIDQKRNFFAHSGLLREFVHGMCVGKEVLIEYKDKGDYRTIKTWVENPND